MTIPASDLYRQIVRGLAPPEDIKLSDWAEKNIVLPEGQSARPGPYRNWPYFREILDAIGDRGIERITLVKPVRTGYTKAIMIALAAEAATDPGPAILLMPTDEHARGVSVDEIEPLFRSSPALYGLLRKAKNDGHTTLLRKDIAGGGVIKILSARAPSKLRRHDCRLLVCDEVDSYEITSEGDALALAEKRTLAQANRKIVIGSTPADEDTSVVWQRYQESDQRIFEVPCPRCGSFSVVEWSDIQWESGLPETAQWQCPQCHEMVNERHKVEMVENGRWRALRPDVKGHRGYWINALVSLLPNASWGKLAREYLEAKRGGPALMQPFYNTILAKPWRTTINRVDADVLADRAEPWGLQTSQRETRIPDHIMLITAGVDTQDDRLELGLVGFPISGAPCILGHAVFAGNTLEDGVWRALDAFLKTRWVHPRGWLIGIDGCAIDSGGREGRTQKVYDFCYPRMDRCVFAIKGLPGPRKIWSKLNSVKGDMRAFGIAVDVIKTEVLDRLSQKPFDEDGMPNAQAFRFSDQLGDEFLEQLCSETRRIIYVKSRPTIVFVPKKAGARNEGLDTVVYALGVRQAPPVRAIDMRARAARPAFHPQGPAPAAIQQSNERPKGIGAWAEKFAQL